MCDTFPERMRSARGLCAQIWARGLLRRHQYARSMTALGQSSMDEWWVEVRLAQEALRVARGRLGRAVGGPGLG
eukprot:457434-Pyramimonas_sp.AAC.1